MVANYDIFYITFEYPSFVYSSDVKYYITKTYNDFHAKIEFITIKLFAEFRFRLKFRNSDDSFLVC